MRELIANFNVCFKVNIQVRTSPISRMPPKHRVELVDQTVARFQYFLVCRERHAGGGRVNRGTKDVWIVRTMHEEAWR